MPINNISDYLLLLILTVVIFCGDVRASARAWMIAVAVVIVAAFGQALLSPPRIEEGHNVFLPSAALERGLPGDVYRKMAADFDAQYPTMRRCDTGCLQNDMFPESTVAFSADGVRRKTDFSRAASGIDFSDPVWLRPGFVNEFCHKLPPDADVLTWFLTMLVVMVWFQRVGLDRLKRRYPSLSERLATHPWSRWLASGLNRLQKASA